MPDLPSSPRKTVSSTSAAARSQTQKKPGAPKPKGAVRAKSGCYTCRIRRKKCDEQPNGDGACQTCVRLRLQCLGFGAKRPDWMRENNSVTELRDKIKTFLASQGMIKGHSGSGPRSTDGDPPVLVLVENLHPSSPATPTLSQSSADGYRPPGPLPPPIRDNSHYPHPMPPHDQHYAPPPSWQSHVPELNHHDPNRGAPVLPNVNDMLYPNSAPLLTPSASILPLNTSPPWPNGTYMSHPQHYLQPIQHSYQHSQQRPPPSPMNPAIGSSFSPLYYLNNPAYSDDEQDNNSPPIAPLPLTLGASHMIMEAANIPTSDLIEHYLKNVFPIQYLMADRSVQRQMSALIQRSPAVKDAACMLAAIHMVYTQRAPQNMVPAQFRRLLDSLPHKDQYSEGDAMAGLHVVSTYLFSGGRGSWAQYLNIASQFVRSALDSTDHYGPEDVLKSCTDTTRFIIKTTFWFDVLASVTTLQVPQFLHTYQQLFDPAKPFIDDPEANEKFSMLPVMGCENHIVLAIAEITNLAYWKASQLRRRCLSIPELVKRGKTIEDDFIYTRIRRSYAPMNGHSSTSSTAAYSSTSTSNDYRTHYAPNSRSEPIDSDLEIKERRKMTNEIFRAAARVYLHSVLSGDYPDCPEIIQGVREVIGLLQKVSQLSPGVQRGVVRNVVFAICIVGCLTDDHRQRDVLLHLLRAQEGESVGNLREVEKLIQAVWAERLASRGEPIDWREIMRRSHTPDTAALLLV